MTTQYERQTQQGGSFANGEVLAESDTPTEREYEALYVGTQGDVTLHCVNGGTLTYVNAVGYIWKRNKGITTGTTAEDIIGEF